VILKLYGYARGAFFLDHLVDYFKHPPVMPERPEELAPDDFERLQIKLLIKASILARVLPVNGSLPKKLAILADAVEVIERGLAPATPAMPSFEPVRELAGRTRPEPSRPVVMPVSVLEEVAGQADQRTAVA
jgi:hypothetical protein